MWNALIRIWHFHVTTLKMADTSQPRPVNQRVIRDRLSMWEAKTNPTAPLTAKQKDALIELTAIAAERPVPPEVRIFVEAMFVIFRQIELSLPHPPPTPPAHLLCAQYRWICKDPRFPCLPAWHREFNHFQCRLQRKSDGQSRPISMKRLLRYPHWPFLCDFVAQTAVHPPPLKSNP